MNYVKILFPIFFIIMSGYYALEDNYSRATYDLLIAYIFYRIL